MPHRAARGSPLTGSPTTGAIGCPGTNMKLGGWGRYPVETCCVLRPEGRAPLARALAQGRTVLARGLGRSYGDAALNPAGLTVMTDRLDRLLEFDPESGRLRAEAGVSLDTILEVFVPRGWFPAVTPGTKFVTLGGMVAADVHGKNHHRDGSFGRFVSSLQVLLGSGEEVTCTPTSNADLFHATLGGLGLTGIVTEVEFSLQRIETSYVTQQGARARSLDELLDLLVEHEESHQYCVSWIDCLQQGAALGRGIVMSGESATLDQLTLSAGRDPLRVQRSPRLRVPVDAPERLLNRFSMRAFNEAYFRFSPGGKQESLVHYDSFFYPLDFIHHWNRLYGRSGFVQYQCMIPKPSGPSCLRDLLRKCSDRGAGFLAVLKTFGEGAGWLSFPAAGYTVTFDFAVRPGLLEFLDGLDDVVLDAGGRVYLAKDARLSPPAFRRMYPAFETWSSVRRQWDPDQVFRSALSSRLELD